MADTIAGMGVGTISSTTTGPGSAPYVTITATGDITTTNYIQITPIDTVKDVEGEIRLSWTRVDDDTMTVSADRQLPAGTEIVFHWLSTSQ